MSRHRATLLDVARRAGVSRTTASFVMTGRDQDMRISAGARDRVLRAAHELDYRPNLMARGLRTKITRTIALISDTIATEQYAGLVVAGSLAAAVEHDHLLFIGETEGDHQVESRLIGDFLDRQVDGFIYASMYTQPVQVPRALRGQPLVLLNSIAASGRVPTVIPDESRAGRAAAQALLAAGHREHIYVIGERAQDKIAGHDRLQGIEREFAAAGVELAGIVDCRWWPEPAVEAVAVLLATGAPLGALICMNDRIAFGVYQALHDAGLLIPHDVSVISFDDTDLATWLRPQLSSITIPHFAMGRRAVELLLEQPIPDRIERLAMPLRERSSIGPPRSIAVAPRPPSSARLAASGVRAGPLDT